MYGARCHDYQDQAGLVNYWRPLACDCGRMVASADCGRMGLTPQCPSAAMRPQSQASIIHEPCKARDAEHVFTVHLLQ